MATADRSIPLASNVISGKILHKESGDGIPNLLVELFDLDNWADPEGTSSPVILRTGAPASPPDPATAAAVGDIATLYKSADRLGSRITGETGEVSFEVT